MKNRLFEKVREAERSKRKLFCAFLTLGYPDVRTTEKLIEGFVKRGVDIVELGFPFSDPLADGPAIQYSSERAIEKGVSTEAACRVVRNLRRRGVEIPILFFSYLNPILRSGLKSFPDRLKLAGFDGLIVPDCPPEEEGVLWKKCRQAGMATVFFVTPTTQPERARKIFARSQGFLYYVSVRGVTGMRKGLPADLAANVRRLVRMSRKPVLVGFGVSTPTQVRQISRLGGGVIVGSAIVEKIKSSHGKLGPVLSFVEALGRPIRK